ncbi:MAG: lipid A biosynthesis lauroyl acyltransferase [Hydrogenophilales bacterium 17-61-9]|nr:MAG: lipid A biosynthesis lauroyl acyltransferase [Hydrogenophilales bacterium 17-61-9]
MSSRMNRALLILLKLVARLPLPLLHGIGIVLGWLIYWAPGRHSARMRNNVFDSGLCSPGADCRRLLRQSIAESGKAIIELLPVWLRPYEQVLKLVKGRSGWEAIDAAREAGKGIILIGPHIGCFELLNLDYAARHPFTAMYKPPRKAVLSELMLNGRQRGQATLVPTDLSGVRAQLAALKRHEAIGILPDQVATGGDGVWAPFLGRPAYTPTLVASLQRKTGAVEDGVRRFPAQYLWSYNRHKRPGDAPPADAAPT